MPDDPLALFARLGAALAIGLLVGMALTLVYRAVKSLVGGHLGKRLCSFSWLPT